MPSGRRSPRWLAPGDWSAFFGLALDNTTQLVILSSLLIGVFKFPADLVLGRMVPGTAAGVLVGDLVYTVLAVRLMRRTGRDDVTAMPFGIDTPSLFGIVFGVLGPVMLLTGDAELAWKMFTDPAQTAVLVVTLPEELPVTETLELVGAIEDDLRLPLGALVVNGVLPVLFSEAEARELATVLEGEADGDRAGTPSAAASGVRAAARRAVQERAQSASLARIAGGTGLPRIVLPFLFEDAATPAAIERFSGQF